MIYNLTGTYSPRNDNYYNQRNFRTAMVYATAWHTEKKNCDDVKQSRLSSWHIVLRKINKLNYDDLCRDLIRCKRFGDIKEDIKHVRVCAKREVVKRKILCTLQHNSLRFSIFIRIYFLFSIEGSKLLSNLFLLILACNRPLNLLQHNTINTGSLVMLGFSSAPNMSHYQLWGQSFFASRIFFGRLKWHKVGEI